MGEHYVGDVDAPHVIQFVVDALATESRAELDEMKVVLDRMDPKIQFEMRTLLVRAPEPLFPRPVVSRTSFDQSSFLGDARSTRRPQVANTILSIQRSAVCKMSASGFIPESERELLLHEVEADMAAVSYTHLTLPTKA